VTTTHATAVARLSWARRHLADAITLGAGIEHAQAEVRRREVAVARAERQAVQA
jgi:hypothetical protein